VCDLIARRIGVEDILFPTHREYGNTVSASVPLAMSLALRANRLERGHRVLIVVGSAGISVGFCSFTF
jgi:3-oxoacyl-[acyl-carrier-protein] synthase III